ncbi:MAG: peptidoglycan DD-metalloendopeptidase family protein [Chloroflexi bacterium]|nr:peptidoglycan DD-metalloendopeptidase family protein [Chloroflexota bacterium]
MPPDKPFQLSVTARFRVWAAPLLMQLRDFWDDVATDMPLLTRIASHVGLLVLIALTIAASGVQLNVGNERTDPQVAALGPIDPSELQDPGTDDTGNPVHSPIPLTDAPKRARRDVVKYTVQSGDTVSDIASQFNVSADSVLWANPKLEDNPDMLSVGQALDIPPVTGVLYTVQSGDSVQKIADKFKSTKVTPSTLVQNIVGFEYNAQHHELKPPDYHLTVGQFLMVPDGYKPYIPRTVNAYSGPLPATAARGTGNFGWPVSGRITQGFWTRHPGIDIGAPKGTPIYAADSGYVIVAGWDQETVSYGFMILINHGNGYLTRYGHLSAFAVGVGDSVKKGQLIGRVGSTGNSTGPHLHFEIIKNGVRRNPFNYLPGG